MPAKAAPQSALSRTKRAHAEMRGLEAAGATGKQVREWRGVVAQANRELAQLQRKLAAVRERAAVEHAVMLEEVRAELVAREANAVRTADRFRDFCARTSSSVDGDGSTAGERAFERAQSAAASIEASLAGLCTHSLNANVGTAMRLERARDDASECGGSDV